MPFSGKLVEVKTTKPKIYSRWNRVREEVVEDETPSIVDPAGYVDPNKRIEEYIKAGMRIDAWNRSVFDYENEQDGEEKFDVEEYDGINDDLEDLRKGEISLGRYQQTMEYLYKSYLSQQDPQEVTDEQQSSNSATDNNQSATDSKETK
ncbi:hypothetical protein [Tortoise microvirus 27]|nr:hypothetical protein [Tortoise microvirus 27]